MTFKLSSTREHTVHAKHWTVKILQTTTWRTPRLVKRRRRFVAVRALPAVLMTTISCRSGAT
jgi:hypothetical protein